MGMKREAFNKTLIEQPVVRHRLAKADGGMVIAHCAEVATLLFGGNGYTKSGQGERIERIYREVMGVRIPGGSEDVMLDLAVRQLLKNYQAATKALKSGSRL